MILCIESAHCYSNFPNVLRNAKQLLRNDSSASLVIADIFDKQEIDSVEQAYLEAGFTINKKEVITFNVKYAMQLDKPRVEKYINLISTNALVKRFLRNFFAIAEDSKTYLELGRSKEYICYILKRSGGERQ